MITLKKSALAVLLIAGLVGMFSGCSNPYYKRSVQRTYGPDNKIVSTVVTEDVEQLDPWSVPLLDVLENQTFQK